MTDENEPIFTVEVFMKHFDGKGSPRVQQMKDLLAKEASYIQAVGYTPTPNIMTQAWEDMVHRDKLYNK